ncbi:MAG TPA: hypothetical protein VL096_13790, partial [Pirellulaceae bacterium]|nr:hypothetical protein [Pirellulaceae bacterium]
LLLVAPWPGRPLTESGNNKTAYAPVFTDIHKQHIARKPRQFRELRRHQRAPQASNSNAFSRE